jgi:GT2 family glycosyltransferase
MKLSVIIPCLNAAATLGDQLEALAGQEHDGAWELILADNGSHDDTPELVAAYRSKIANLRLVDASQRRGQAHAKNAGARAATGEALLFTDADDRVGAGYLAAMARALEEHVFVACRYDDAALNEPWTRHCHSSSPQAEGLNPYTYPPFLPHAGGSSLGIRRVLHEEIGGFDESLPALEDTDYCWRLQLAGHELRFVPEALVHIRYRGTLAAIYRQSFQYAVHNVLLYQRYQGRGMPRLPWYAGAGSWAKLLLRTPQLLSRGGRAAWTWQLAWRLGRLRGSLRYRVLAL